MIIEDDVEIASGCTIDRGSVDDTVIGKNTYLDNQVHIAHNVKIGSNCMIAGQVGFAEVPLVTMFYLGREWTPKLVIMLKLVVAVEL